MNRRSFLEAAGLVLGGLTMSSLTLAPSSAPGSAATSAAPPPRFVRSEVHSSAGVDMLVPYAVAVEKMQARAVTDPTSWSYQAAMHGTTVRPLKTAWNSCQHGSFFFLSWHRMYLYYFERIARQSSGFKSFALPYWNYEPVTQRKLPVEFRSPANASNYLYTAERNPGINAGTLEMPATDSDPTWALAQTTFKGQSPDGFGGAVTTGPQHGFGKWGRLEIRPHNAIHGDIGEWMGNTNTAAQDPIFWLHHANIDRLWNLWLSMGSGRANPPVSELWGTQVFTFYDESGTAVTMKGADVVDAATQLDYRYDTEPGTAIALDRARERVRVLNDPQGIRLFSPPASWPPAPPEAFRSLDIRTTAPVTVSGTQASTTVRLSAGARQGLRSAVDTPERRVVLALDGLTVTASPGGMVDIFLVAGTPQGGSLARRLARDQMTYVGTLDFFSITLEAMQPDGWARDVVLTIDVTDVARRQLHALGQGQSAFTVVFRARGPVRVSDKSPAPLVNPVTIRRVSLHVL